MQSIAPLTQKMDSNQTNDDALLVQRISQDCASSFKVLFLQYIDPVTNYAYHICGNEELANDVAQEVFMKVWEKRATLDSRKSIKYFLFVLVRNIIISNFRKLGSYKKYRDHFQFTAERNSNSLEKQLEANELSSLITSAIDKLPEKRKKVFQLSRNDALSYMEIAEKLDISPRTVEVHIALAIKNIREYLRIQYS